MKVFAYVLIAFIYICTGYTTPIQAQQTGGGSGSGSTSSGGGGGSTDFLGAFSSLLSSLQNGIQNMVSNSQSNGANPQADSATLQTFFDNSQKTSGSLATAGDQALTDAANASKNQMSQLTNLLTSAGKMQLANRMLSMQMLNQQMQNNMSLLSQMNGRSINGVHLTAGNPSGLGSSTNGTLPQGTGNHSPSGGFFSSIFNFLNQTNPSASGSIGSSGSGVGGG